MDKDAYLEINASQRPALALFEAMGYTYISPADCDKQRGSRYHVLLRDILRGQLRSSTAMSMRRRKRVLRRQHRARHGGSGRAADGRPRAHQREDL